MEQVKAPSRLIGDKPVFLRPVHVLHIDDAEAGRLVVRGMLESCTYPQFVIHSFGSIQEAEVWASPNVQQVDCILLDLTLAESEGAETFMHALSAFQQVPIVVLTASRDIDLAYQLTCAGADSYLLKDLATQANLPLFISVAIARKTRTAAPSLRVTEAVNALREVAKRAREGIQAGTHDGS